MGFYVASSAPKTDEAALESADATGIFVFFNSLIGLLENAACTFRATVAGPDA